MEKSLLLQRLQQNAHKEGDDMFEDYLTQIGLEELTPHIKTVQLNTIVADIFDQTPPSLSCEEIKNLYVYTVPKISRDGSCSIIDEPADKPYNLAETFRLTSRHSDESENQMLDQVEDDQKIYKALKDNHHTLRLWRLHKIVKKIYQLTGVNWFGIYRKVYNVQNELVLVKEAYKGLFSRPEFPLTQEFAKKSNNSTVGLTGKAKIIQDVYNSSGPYYKCDGKVQSEFCLPIFSPSPHSSTSGKGSIYFPRPLGEGQGEGLIGILDAEAFPKIFFTNERLLQISKVAFDLGQRNLGV